MDRREHGYALISNCLSKDTLTIQARKKKKKKKTTSTHQHFEIPESKYKERQ
jgi:hypothetical protein